MSIVGTRPPLIGEVSEYELHHRARLWYFIRLISCTILMVIWSVVYLALPSATEIQQVI